MSIAKLWFVHVGFCWRINEQLQLKRKHDCVQLLFDAHMYVLVDACSNR